LDGLKLAEISHHSLGKSDKLTRGNAGKWCATRQVDNRKNKKVFPARYCCRAVFMLLPST
jgi:hypothetical protein